MLIICPECGKKYSVKSPRCPYCQEPRPYRYKVVAEDLRKDDRKKALRKTFTYHGSSNDGDAAKAMLFFTGILILIVCLINFTSPSKSYLKATQPPNVQESLPVQDVPAALSVQVPQTIQKTKAQIRNHPRPTNKKQTKTTSSNTILKSTMKDTNSYVIEGKQEESLGEVIDKILTARKQRKSSPKNDDLNTASSLSNGAANYKSTSDDKKPKHTYSSGYSSGGSVYVHGYYRNGHYVRSHTRSRPGGGRRR